MTTRANRRSAARQPSGVLDRIRPALFAVIAVGVLAAGTYLAFGDFLNRPAAAAGTIDVQSSMAGFSPSEIHVRAGSTVTLDWWTQDAAIHLQGGAHTMISPELGMNEALPAESRRQVVWTVPDKPGTYDVYCDTCCGGKESPTMHGRIVIEPASA
jgi:cytochrome c oxidase subunit II